MFDAVSAMPNVSNINGVQVANIVSPNANG